MKLTKVVAKIKLSWHLNMIGFCTIANHLKLMSNENMVLRGLHHMKKCNDCCKLLGYELPKEFVDL